MRSDDDLATIALTTFEQVSCPGLFESSHKFAHSGLDLTNGVVIAVTITINHDKFVVLHLFKEVWHFERCLEVWVKTILDLLRFANLRPFAIDFLEDKTYGVRLAKCIQVLQFAT